VLWEKRNGAWPTNEFCFGVSNKDTGSPAACAFSLVCAQLCLAFTESTQPIAGACFHRSTTRRRALDALLQAAWRRPLTVEACLHRTLPQSAEASPDPTAHAHEPHDQYSIPRYSCPVATRTASPFSIAARPTSCHRPRPALLAQKKHVQTLRR